MMRLLGVFGCLDAVCWIFVQRFALGIAVNCKIIGSLPISCLLALIGPYCALFNAGSTPGTSAASRDGILMNSS